MTQSNEPSDRNQEIDRQLRDLRRRADRLEYLQVPPQEFSRSFDRVYDEIDALEDIVNERFDRMNERFDQLEGKVQELNRKFDIVMQYVTGQEGTN
jgi:predicted nuclease with TOPRIM domain